MKQNFVPRKNVSKHHDNNKIYLKELIPKVKALT